jgi:hypothetical protein
MGTFVTIHCPDCGTPLPVEVHVHSIQNPKDSEHMSFTFAGASVRHKCPPRPAGGLLNGQSGQQQQV